MNSQAGDGGTFRERVDMENLPIGSTLSGGVLEVRPGSNDQEEIERLQRQVLVLRLQVGELEQALEARPRTGPTLSDRATTIGNVVECWTTVERLTRQACPRRMA